MRTRLAATAAIAGALLLGAAAAQAPLDIARLPRPGQPTFGAPGNGDPFFKHWLVDQREPDQTVQNGF